MTVKELRDKLSVYKDDLEVVYTSKQLMKCKTGKIYSIDVGDISVTDKHVILSDLANYDN